jgi:hypothetical protein
MESELLTSRPGVESSDPGFRIGEKVTSVPRCRTLAGFALEAGCEEGIAIESLEPGTTLTVRTVNSQYRLIVIDGARHRVLVEGGDRFPEATPVVLQGSSADGSLVKTGWIGVGLRVELRVGPRRILTSRVRSVAIDTCSM